MADPFDREEHEGGGFMMGLLTGTVLGAGLGMLLAPKRGTELRSQIGEQVTSLGRRASDVASGLMHRESGGGEQPRGSVASLAGAASETGGVHRGSPSSGTPGGNTLGASASPGAGATGGSTYTGDTGGLDRDRF